MPMQSATATGGDLATVLTSALADLIDDDGVEVSAHLPAGVDLGDVRVEVGAAVTWIDESDEAPSEDASADDGDATQAPSDDGDATQAPSADGSTDDGDPTSDGGQGAPDPVSDSPVAASNGSSGAGQAVDDSGDVPAADTTPPPSMSEEELDELDEEADAGADFVEGLLDAMDLPGELQIRVLEDVRRAEVEVVDMGSGALIGRRGSTLEAIQELMRCALQSQFERRVHVHVDVEGYRARRLEKLLDKADDAIDEVLDTGNPERLEPMDVFERKAIHEFVNTVDGVLSRSQGREPSRRVVIEPSE